ncbi:expressed unknown protein [Seminavis robusta]|uniref:Uncharacterized protein n=1 Tax=Seminavis robusta TaxID=568900 RepID=A0A9N8DX81_9STRA|nr:expressed unknown protein [Seminavis robusta]|eukprot:Sro349_g123571.1  (227) ;mRNA; f:60297-60977
MSGSGLFYLLLAIFILFVSVIGALGVGSSKPTNTPKCDGLIQRFGNNVVDIDNDSMIFAEFKHDHCTVNIGATLQTKEGIVASFVEFCCPNAQALEQAISEVESNGITHKPETECSSSCVHGNGGATITCSNENDFFGNSTQLAFLVLGCFFILVHIWQAWSSKLRADEAKQANVLAREANTIKANRIAIERSTEANTIAERSNAIAEQANTIAEAANRIATGGNP